MSDQPPQYTNYPRASYQTNPFGRPPGVYLEVLGDAWKLVTRDLTTWLLSSLIFLIIVGVCYGIAFVAQVAFAMGGNLGYEPGSLSEMVGYQLKSMVIGLPVGVAIQFFITGLSNLAARQATGQTISVGDMFLPFRRFGPVLATSFLVQIAISVGTLALIVPGIYLYGALSLATLISLNQDIGPVEALGRSIRALGSGAWMMFLLIFVLGIIVGVSMCACGIGLLFSIPVMAACIGLHYFYYFPPEAPAYAPTGGPVDA